MKKLSIGASFIVGMLVILRVSGQETKTLWQKDIESSTQDFLSAMTVTIDRQILLSGSSILTPTLSKGEGGGNNGYDYHLVKLDQQGGNV